MTYEEKNRVLLIEWPKVHSGTKKCKYEMVFDATLDKITNGWNCQFDENDNFFDCFPLCDPELPDGPLNPKKDRLLFNRHYFDSYNQGLEVEQRQLKKMPHNSPMKSSKTLFNLRFVDDNYGTSNNFLIIERLISFICRRINIDSLLQKKPSIQKTFHAIKQKDQGNGENSDEGYLSST